MTELVAYSTVAVTLGLVVARPRLHVSLRLSPAMAASAGVLVMLALGIVTPAHWVAAATNLWTPFVAIASIMVMTEVARTAGLLEWWATIIDARATSTPSLFLLVFGLGVLTSAAFNNDAAILLLTPVVVSLVQRRYPGQPEMVPPFAFAVFMSAGVAALPVSNPMNMVVATFLHIGFAEYVRHMLPLAVVGWVAAFGVLRWIFSAQLRTPIGQAVGPAARATPLQRVLMLLLGGVLVAYPIFGALGGPIWMVAVAGAVLSLILSARRVHVGPVALVVRGVSWETLVFLLAVLVMSMGLRDVGLVARLAGVYEHAGPITVGFTSAIGSALLNNHPMSHLNMMALDLVAQARSIKVFAALVGGDLGPRLLPMGSLAGLIWIEMLGRQGIDVGVGRFVRVGAIVAVPTIALSLLLLALY